VTVVAKYDKQSALPCLVGKALPIKVYDFHYKSDPHPQLKELNYDSPETTVLRTFTHRKSNKWRSELGAIEKGNG